MNEMHLNKNHERNLREGPFARQFRKVKANEFFL
jgi:hypothetical protein